MLPPSTLRPAPRKQVSVGYVCWSPVQLTLGELIHKVVGDLLERGCIDGKQLFETLNFIDEVLVGGVVERRYRHGQVEAGPLRTQCLAPSARPLASVSA